MSGTRVMRAGRFVAAAVVGLGLLAGCRTDPIVPDDLNPAAVETPDAGVPGYGELVERYNANAEALPRVWARTRVAMRWEDERGRKRREAGDGRLIFERPLNTAWTVEVLGDVKLWAGSDAQGFWVFDRLDDGRAYYGRYGAPLARPLPLPVQPEAVPYLLGLMPLDPSRRPPAPEVETFRGYYLIEPPGLGLRMMLDPATARPVRIDLTDSRGRSALTSRLSGAVEVDGPDGVTAVLPETAKLYPQGQEAEMTVTLRRATTDERRIKRKWFDFDGLVEAMKPDAVVDLNEPAAAR
ncbi:MAG: hypothetical protein AAF800_13170 [Planctomycetota bacterium]